MTNNRRQTVRHRHFINSALLDNNVGRIELWGDVYENQPIDPWTGKPLDIQCITVKDFKDALDKIQHCNSIELHLNSYGGDATVGILIHNLLKKTGKKITCVIDAVACSAAFTIAMAADEVQVYPGSILMCHEVKSFMFGYYGNDDLKKIENGNTAYNNSAAAMYSQKSGMSKAQCLNLMKKETWMYGEEAISYGFADTLLGADEEEKPVELINKTTIKINGVEHDISGLNIPEEFIQKTQEEKNLGGNGMSKEGLKDKLINAISAIFKNEVDEEEEKEQAEIKEEEEKQDTEGDEEEKEKENKTKSAEGEDEEEKEPEDEEQEKEEQEEKENAINQEIVNSAVEAERKRIQEIEEIANTIDADLVQEAKFGNNACDAKELALRAMQREKEKTNNALADLKADTEQSKVNEVESVQAAEIVDEENLTESQAQNAVKAMYKKLNQAKEEK